MLPSMTLVPVHVDPPKTGKKNKWWANINEKQTLPTSQSQISTIIQRLIMLTLEQPIKGLTKYTMDQMHICKNVIGW